MKSKEYLRKKFLSLRKKNILMSNPLNFQIFLIIFEKKNQKGKKNYF